MRGWLLIMAIVVVLSLTVHATTPLNESLCSDTDAGGEHSKDAALKVKGQVKYGLTTLSDTCMTSSDGVSTNASKWLKEYFCRDDKRDSDVYDCTRFGYNGCVDGECTGNGTTSTQSSTTAPESSCGNKILEKSKGEECDPPDKICFGKTSEQYGLCSAACKCKISAAAPAAPEVCGDGTKDSNEECEKDGDCPTDFLCSSCKCVKQLSAEEIEAMKKNASAAQAEKEKNISKEIEEKYKTPELSEVNLTSENFTEAPGMKATSGIANFFRKIFGWIAGLFS